MPMKKLKFIAVLSCLCAVFSGFLQNGETDGSVFIPPSSQRTGDAQQGYQYLTTGDYEKAASR
jgi:hypothetical protein